MCGIILTCVFYLLIPFSCVAIYSPGDEVTKPPLQWVGLPWPRRDHHSRHAWLPDDNINVGTIDHVKHVGDTQNNQEPQQSEVKWKIVPDPTRTGGFKMIRTSGDEQEDIPSEELDFNSPGFAQGQQQQTEILASGVTRGDGGVKGGHPSLDALASGMSFGSHTEQNTSTINNQHPSLDVISSGMSYGDNPRHDFTAQSNQYPSLDVLTSGMSYGDNIRQDLSAESSQVPSLDILSSGMSYGNKGRETATLDHSNTQSSGLGHESELVQRPALWNQQLEIESFGTYNDNTPDELQKLDSAYSVAPGRREVAASSSALLKATCPAGATGQFVYIQDCRRFLNCWKGRGFIQACAPGTLFNPDTQECDFPMKVKCLNAPHNNNRREGRVLSNTEKPIVNSRPQQQKGSDCPMPGGTGLAPHPTDCAKFLNCWKGAPHVQDCAPGTLFNAQTLVCDFPYNVICKPASNPPHSTGTAEILEGPAEKYEESSEPRRSYCTMEGGSGMTSHPTDCSKYISCWKGVPHTQSCGPGTLFNPLTLHCDFPQNVNCTSLQNPENAPGKPSPNKPILPNIVPTTKRTTPKTTTSTTTTTTSTTPATTTTTTTTTMTPSIVTPSTTLTPPSSRGLEGVVGSGQTLRLRGGPSPWEGYVEVQGSIPGWGLVCDETNRWTILEANVVCQQLGYERGAEMSWQGRPIQSTEDTQRVAVGKVSCIGTESSLSSCQLVESSHCIIARDAVGVRCYRNWLSQCKPHEVNYRGHCYELVVPHEHHSTVGFTHAEAMEDCQNRGGHLLDINSQEENDFISEWLIQLQPNITNVLTAGVGVSVTRRTIWIWEGSNAPIAFNKWWPGWTGEHREAPVIGQRPLCIVAKRVFPCELAYYTNHPVDDIHSHHHDENKKLCAANYFYWDTEDCSITHSHPYICERPVDDIGCLPKSGRMYLGKANVTVSGSACLPWDDPTVVSKLGYRVSRRERLANLTGHNHCRYIGSSSQPWCYDREGKKEDCDIPPCWSNVLEKTVSLTIYGCGANEYECKPGECIPTKWKCNGVKDCSNGYDEQDCWAEMLNKFSKHRNRRLRGHIREKWMKTNIGTCARYCIESKGFTCKSFSHKEDQNECLLSDSNRGLSGSVVQENGWHYFEVTAHSILCKNNSRFECDNGKCVNISQVCNGKNECGDKSDEKDCSAEYLGYAIRLAGSNVSNEGRLEVKVFGKWGVVCDDLFAMRNAEVACRELGFHLGAVEVLPPGSYSPRGIMPFLMDDLKCTGNETTLRHCDFQGWGVHDCLPDEAVSILCSVPGQACPLNKWQCRVSKECIPVMYLCDNIDDCDDASDEDPDQCNQAVEIRLSGGSSNMEGRVEVKYHGMWGTICDDDVSVAAARVICRSLGFGGPAEVKKNAAFGPGEGQIWLDQLHCSGNESSIIQCLHPPWGEHNCQHNEDVSVVCSRENTRHSDFSHTMEIAPGSDDVIQVSSILPGQCGKRSTPEVEYEHVARVVGGNEVPKGSYPWQASIRVKNGQKSVHWCGAVVLSPLHILTAGHCMVDYTKSMYFVRVGDHDTEEIEEFEQELNIDQIYMHEQFNKGVRLNNDIALVKLKGLGIQLGDTVQPVCLPEAGTTYSTSLNCTVSGWGSLKAAGSGYSRRLRAAWLPILPSETCTAGYVYGNNSIGEGMFCAGQLEGGVDSCQGDSGGPFVCFVNDEFVLYGITSWGHGCGRANKPGVYTNVSYYKEWINQKLKDSMTGH